MIDVRGLLAKLGRYGKIVLFSKKRFSMPPRSRWLIYDGGGSRHLLRIMYPETPEIYFNRGEELNLAVMLRAMFRRNSSISDAYEDCYIQAVKPHIILTFVDNGIRFYRLSKRHPHIKTIFIQNGGRGGVNDIFHNSLTYPATKSEGFHVDIMCTFGEVIGSEYCKYVGGKSIAVGSLLSNEYPVTRTKKIRRLAYISMCDGKENYAPAATRLVLRELKRYCLSRAIPLVVVGRSAHSSEQNYYRKVLGRECLFQPRTEQFGSYRYLDETEVSVSIDSSLGFETVARGNKNAFFSILQHFYSSKESNFGWPASYPDEGPFWTNHPDPDTFDRILDYLFEIDDVQWRNDIETTNFSSLIIHDPGNSIIRSIFEKELKWALLASH